MNRRSFFNSLSSAVAGIYIACHVNIGRIAEMASEAVKPAEFVINPAWVDAPYEILWVRSGSNTISSHLWDRKRDDKPHEFVNFSEPARYDGSRTLIPKFIEI